MIVHMPRLLAITRSKMLNVEQKHRLCWFYVHVDLLANILNSRSLPLL